MKHKIELKLSKVDKTKKATSKIYMHIKKASKFYWGPFKLKRPYPLEGPKYSKLLQISSKSPIKSENKQISFVLIYIYFFF